MKEIDLKLIEREIFRPKRLRKNPPYSHENYLKYKESRKRAVKKYYQKNKEIIKPKIISWQKNNREKLNSWQKKHTQTLKFKAINYYSEGSLSCNCCGENLLDLLTIDHINNDGKEHRKIVTHIYSWLKSHDYPQGFQVLCMNCNWGRSQQKDHICPHQKVVKK